MRSEAFRYPASKWWRRINLCNGEREKKDKWCIRDNQLVSTRVNREANANFVILFSLTTIQSLSCPCRLHGMAWHGSGK